MGVAVKRKLSACFLALSVTLASGAQLLFRFAMLHHGTVEIGLLKNVLVFTPDQLFALLTGVLLYAVSMISWIFALIRFEVTVAYPVMSISYVIVYLAAAGIPVYNESISFAGLIGMAFIVVGVCIVPLAKVSNSKGRAQA